MRLINRRMEQDNVRPQKMMLRPKGANFHGGGSSAYQNHNGMNI